MQYYTRSLPARRGAKAPVPGSAFTPNGKIHLAVPMGSHEFSSDDGGSSSARGSSGGNLGGSAASDRVPGLVLMLPAIGAGDRSESGDLRMWLLVFLAADACALVAGLVELHWRRVHRTSLLLTGLIGLCSNAAGAVASRHRMPQLLGVFAVACALQFVVGTLLLQSLPQLMHLALLPFAGWHATLVRKTLIPLWYSVGTRIR